MIHFPPWFYAILFLVGIVCGSRLYLWLNERRKPRLSTVAKELRDAGLISQWPPPPADPLNPEPKAIRPILFEDGFRIDANDIYGRGLMPVIDGDGRVIYVVDPYRKSQKTVEEWCGLDHGARIS